MENQAYSKASDDIVLPLEAPMRKVLCFCLVGVQLRSDIQWHIQQLRLFTFFRARN